FLIWFFYFPEILCSSLTFTLELTKLNRFWVGVFWSFQEIGALMAAKPFSSFRLLLSLSLSLSLSLCSSRFYVQLSSDHSSSFFPLLLCLFDLGCGFSLFFLLF
ncbi:hypothetical protein PanWU01x14_004880, partial [Parasponia andersonii]